jgi:N-acetylglucosaminyldiphosphoundecaprenol N-acetyl-beta-D-mannosaminyltransferase
MTSRFSVLGVQVSALNLPTAVRLCLERIRAGGKGYICVRDVHGVVRSQDDPELLHIHNNSFLTTPDGMPLVWLGRRAGFSDVDRVYGPDLLLALCDAGRKDGVRHFFYGGETGVAKALQEKLCERFPGLEVVGTFTPPFRPLNQAEGDSLVAKVAACQPDIIWVGLSTPKQERFMAEWIGRLDAKLMIGVGAAFDFHSGRIKQAPRWIQRSGFEWLYRITQDPQRLLKRYWVNNTKFLWLLVTRRWRDDCRDRVERAGSEALHARVGKAQLLEEVPRRFDVLGVNISAMEIQRAVDLCLGVVEAKGKGYVCVTSAHGVVESLDDAELRRIHNHSFLTTPDGMPLVWLGRLSGCHEIDRVYGPDLMLALCDAGRKDGVRHFFYGGETGVAKTLQEKLCERFPGLEVVGTFTPPFRPLNQAEGDLLVAEVAACQPDIIWVGLSTPKQERFMAEWIGRLDTKLMIGVGAAFDFHSGRIKQAPRWIQRSGLEWLYRMTQDPRRLFKRYMVTTFRFITELLIELVSLPKKIRWVQLTRSPLGGAADGGGWLKLMPCLEPTVPELPSYSVGLRTGLRLFFSLLMGRLNLMVLPVIDETQWAIYGVVKRCLTRVVRLFAQVPLTGLIIRRCLVRKTRVVYLDFSDGAEPHVLLQRCAGEGVTLKRHFDVSRIYPTDTRPLPIFLNPEPYAPFFDQNPKTVDVFWGARPTSPLRAGLRQKLEQMRKDGLNIDMVEQPVPFNEYLARMARARVVVAPSGSGWHCYRPYEALLVGTVPLLDVPPVAYIRYLQDGIHGWYFEGVDGLGDVLAQALKDPKRLLEMALAGRQYVLEHHTREAVFNLYLKKWI